MIKWGYFYFSVNSVCFAPHELGLVLACGSSDGSVSILTSTGIISLCTLTWKYTWFACFEKKILFEVQ